MKTYRVVMTIGVLLVAGTLFAQQRSNDVDETRSAARDGFIEIENPAGSIRVIGWDRSEINVKGRLGRRTDEFRFEVNGRRAEIAVETQGNPHSNHSELEIYVPANSRVEIDSFAADISVSELAGRVRAETVNGSINVSGSSEVVEIESVNGGLEVKGPARRVQAESVNGRVIIDGASGEVEATTVNGRLEVRGGQFDHARLEVVNGRLRFEGALGSRATLDIETVSGSVELLLPRNVSADFTVETFSGDIDNEIGPPAERTSRFTAEKELRFTAGDGGAQVTVQTLSGDVRIRTQ